MRGVFIYFYIFFIFLITRLSASALIKKKLPFRNSLVIQWLGLFAFTIEGPDLTPGQRRQWHPTPVPSLENPMDGGAWWAAVHGVAKSWTRLNDFTLTFHFHALEKEMATHSSILVWRIPGTGEPGGCCLWGHTESDTTELT